jgi:hypothetical protein
MIQNKAKLITAVALGAVLAAAFVGASYGLSADEPAASQPLNGRANHHPRHEAVLENQAVVTDLGGNATAVSYWASAPDGWHVVTTVSTVVGADGDAEQHGFVRFSATLAPGQEQLISVPLAVGERQQVLRIRRVGDRIEMNRIAEPAI